MFLLKILNLEEQNLQTIIPKNVDIVKLDDIVDIVDDMHIIEQST